MDVVTGGLVKTQSGQYYDAKRVLPVSKETKAEPVTTTVRDQEKKTATQQISEALTEFLKVGDEKPLRNVGPWLRRHLPAGQYDEMLRKTRTNLAGVLALHKDRYQLRVSRAGNKENLFVRRMA